MPLGVDRSRARKKPPQSVVGSALGTKRTFAFVAIKSASDPQRTLVFGYSGGLTSAGNLIADQVVLGTAARVCQSGLGLAGDDQMQFASSRSNQNCRHTVGVCLRNADHRRALRTCVQATFAWSCGDRAMLTPPFGLLSSHLALDCGAVP